MLESDLRALFERQASSEPPPAPISIPAARRVGRTYLRRRRAGILASPVFAAGAVLAIVLTGIIPSETMHPSAAQTQPPQVPRRIGTAPREFNPLVEYASFGWLPFSHPFIVGGTGLTYQNLEVSNPSMQQTYIWTALAAGKCRQAGNNLTCSGQSVAMRLTGQAPDIDGHVAYWGYLPLPPPGPVNQILAYQYAEGGWATLEFVGNAYRPDALKIAQTMRLGLTLRLRFAVQLTDLSAQWRLSPDQGFNGTSAGPLDRMFSLISRLRADRNAAGELDVTAQPASTPAAGTCANSKIGVMGADGKMTVIGPGTKQMINGYDVYVNSQDQYLCADNVDGLSVQIRIQASTGVPSLNVISVFAHHLRVLGTNPANWTTNPTAP